MCMYATDITSAECVFFITKQDELWANAHLW
jgi:hypothetical protein